MPRRTRDTKSTFATLGDALSDAASQKLLQRRKALEKRAHELSELQKKHSKRPPKTNAGKRRQPETFLKAKPPSEPIESLIIRPNYYPSSKDDELRPTRRFEFWGLPAASPTREEPPKNATAAQKKKFENYLGCGKWQPHPGELDDLFLWIGLDLGTSSVKVVVQLPYEAGEPKIAIPAPEFCLSDDHQYLWQSVLWVGAKDELSAYPITGGRAIQSLKQGILAAKPGEPVSLGDGSRTTVTRQEAMTAFLAFVARYVRGWLLTNRPNLFEKRRPVWFLNVGVPTATADEEEVTASYRHAASAAFLLSNDDAPIDVETVRAFISEAAKSEVDDVSLVPETTAEASTFARSHTGGRGLYLMVDVGATTLDVCTFRLDTDENKYALIRADVRPLGVEAYYWHLAQGRNEPDFKHQSSVCMQSVVWDTKHKFSPHADCWKNGEKLPVFLAGGGAKNSLHRELVQALGPWLAEHSNNDGIRQLELPEPENMEFPIGPCDYTRLAVAWGLSYPKDEIGTVVMPSEMKEVPRFRAKDFTTRFIDKDMV